MISPSFDGVKWIKSISPKAPTEEIKKSEFDTQFVFLSLLLESLALTRRTAIVDPSQKVEHVEMKDSLLRQLKPNLSRYGNQKMFTFDALQKIEHIEMIYSLLRHVMLNICRCGEQKMPSTESGQKA